MNKCCGRIIRLYLSGGELFPLCRRCSVCGKWSDISRRKAFETQHEYKLMHGVQGYLKDAVKVSSKTERL